MYFIPRSYGRVHVCQNKAAVRPRLPSFLPEIAFCCLFAYAHSCVNGWGTRACLPVWGSVASVLRVTRTLYVCRLLSNFTALTRVWLPSSPRALFTHTCCCVSLSKFSAKQDAVSPCRFASPVPGAPALHLTFVSRAPTAWTARMQPRRPVVAACARRVLIRPKWGLRA